MGNAMCCEQSSETSHQRKQMIQEEGKKSLKHLRKTEQIYYTNPAKNDEDFTFNDKLRQQSIAYQFEGGNVPNFIDQCDKDAQFLHGMHTLAENINKINEENDWENQGQLEKMYAKDSNIILIGRKALSSRELLNESLFTSSSKALKANPKMRNNSKMSFGNRNSSRQSLQSGIQTPLMGFQIAKDEIKESPIKELIEHNSTTNSIVIKMEFTVRCSAVRLSEGIQNLKKFSKKITKHTTIGDNQNEQLSIQNIVFQNPISKAQFDIVFAHHITDIGDNLNNCFASIKHSDFPETLGIRRAAVIQAGHTFFEEYGTINEPDKDLNGSFTSGQSNLTKEKAAFGSVLQMRKVDTKVRFYGEFTIPEEKSEQSQKLDNNQTDEIDESTKQYVLTLCKEYIDICNTIAASTYEREESNSDYSQNISKDGIPEDLPF